MSRRHQEETSFGSDSFLDVIANIVGILIILIVVAGVRVSRAPLVSIDAIEHIQEEPQVVELLSLNNAVEDSPLVVELYNDALPQVEIESETPPAVPDFIPPEVAPLPAIKPIVIDEALQSQIHEHQQKLEKLTQEISNLEAEKMRLLPDSKSEASVLSKKLEELKASQEKLQALLQLIEISVAENKRSQQVVDQLIDKKEQTKELQPETETLAHKLNPVGKIVSGKEVHFRLVGNKISFVPVQQLSELVKRDMQKRRDFLLKQQRFQSRVGPVNGYEMEYLVQREGGGIFDEARYGTGRIRVSVTDWVLRPSGEIFSETLDEAIVPGSQFRTALISEGTNSTITFWVYPDSYELHRQLKQMVHDSGFWVASRPLPVGYPIAGSSTNGSKSIAQ